MLEPQDVIVKPVVTEKSSNLTNWSNQYSFIIDDRANKIDVRHAVEHLWNVKVLDVKIINVKGKPRRLRGNRTGRTPDWKKAVVRLRPDDMIDIF